MLIWIAVLTLSAITTTTNANEVDVTFVYEQGKNDETLDEICNFLDTWQSEVIYDLNSPVQQQVYQQYSKFIHSKKMKDDPKNKKTFMQSLANSIIQEYPSKKEIPGIKTLLAGIEHTHPIKFHYFQRPEHTVQLLYNEEKDPDHKKLITNVMEVIWIFFYEPATTAEQITAKTNKLNSFVEFLQLMRDYTEIYIKAKFSVPDDPKAKNYLLTSYIIKIAEIFLEKYSLENPHKVKVERAVTQRKAKLKTVLNVETQRMPNLHLQIDEFKFEISTDLLAEKASDKNEAEEIEFFIIYLKDSSNLDRTNPIYFDLKNQLIHFSPYEIPKQNEVKQKLWHFFAISVIKGFLSTYSTASINYESFLKLQEVFDRRDQAIENDEYIKSKKFPSVRIHHKKVIIFTLNYHLRNETKEQALDGLASAIDSSNETQGTSYQEKLSKFIQALNKKLRKMKPSATDFYAELRDYFLFHLAKQVLYFAPDLEINLLKNVDLKKAFPERPQFPLLSVELVLQHDIYEIRLEQNLLYTLISYLVTKAQTNIDARMVDHYLEYCDLCSATLFTETKNAAQTVSFIFRKSLIKQLLQKIDDRNKSKLLKKELKGLNLWLSEIKLKFQLPGLKLNLIDSVPSVLAESVPTSPRENIVSPLADAITPSMTNGETDAQQVPSTAPTYTPLSPERREEILSKIGHANPWFESIGPLLKRYWNQVISSF